MAVLCYNTALGWGQDTWPGLHPSDRLGLSLSMILGHLNLGNYYRPGNIPRLIGPRPQWSQKGSYCARQRRCSRSLGSGCFGSPQQKLLAPPLYLSTPQSTKPLPDIAGRPYFTNRSKVCPISQNFFVTTGTRPLPNGSVSTASWLRGSE